MHFMDCWIGSAGDPCLVVATILERRPLLNLRNLSHGPAQNKGESVLREARAEQAQGQLNPCFSKDSQSHWASACPALPCRVTKKQRPQPHAGGGELLKGIKITVEMAGFTGVSREKIFPITFQPRSSALVSSMKKIPGAAPSIFPGTRETSVLLLHETMMGPWKKSLLSAQTGHSLSHHRPLANPFTWRCHGWKLRLLACIQHICYP